MPNAEDSRLRVPEQLQLAGADINRRAGDIVGELNGLRTMLLELESAWQGDARAHYEALQAEWNVAAEGLFGPAGVLGEIASALNASWNNYSQAEWANVRTWAPSR